ncbi:response regulator [Micropruina sp.]|uniref:response regulator n=1 Tax=Micropruina sp. TaxID=2737536 RepID=UPI0039E3A332
MTVVVVDDEVEVRDAYRAFFARRPGFSLIGEAADGQAGVAVVAKLRPDVVLMDLKMPLMSGVDATRAICETDPNARVVALTTLATRDHIVAALRAGASGYLLKDCGAEGLVRGLHDALAGEMPMSPGVRLALVDSVRREDAHTQASSGIVTQREAELLMWLAQGLSNQQIADEMYLSEGSVKQYLNRIADKLGVRSRTQILVRSLQLRIVDLDTLPAMGP